jgi:hypothetical protein
MVRLRLVSLLGKVRKAEKKGIKHAIVENPYPIIPSSSCWHTT